MLEFYLVFAALILLAAVFLWFPVLQFKQSSPQRQQANVQAFREREAELKEQLAAGQLEQGQFDILLAELQRRVLEEADLSDSSQSSSKQSSLKKGQGIDNTRGASWPQRLSLLVVLAVAAVSLYHFTGYRADWKITETLQTARSKVAAGEDAMLERQQLLALLEARLQQRPQEPFYWMLKGNVELEMARNREAVASFAQLRELLPEDVSVMAKLLEAQYIRDRGQLSANSLALAADILQRDPKNVRTLGLMGIHSYESQQYQQAIEYWQQLLPIVGPFSPNGRTINQGIERARAQLAQGATAEAESSSGNAAPANAEPLNGPRITVNLSLAEGIQAEADATVFVYARAAGGPRMPLALQRMRVADLPRQVLLDDSMAMAPGMNLSTASAVEVVARITRQGLATPAPGDVEGVSQVINLGEKASNEGAVIELQINRRIE